MQTTPISSPSKSPNINSVSPTSKVPNSYYNQNNLISTPINIINNNNIIHNNNNNNINNNTEYNSEEESEYESSEVEEPSSPAMTVPNSPSVNDDISSKVVKKTATSQQVAAAKKPRKSYEVYKKLEILDEKNKYGMNFVVKKHHISRSIISRWISNIDKYKSFNKKNLKKLHKGPKASFSMEQENIIIEKINQARQNGEIVSGETIKKFALELSKQLNNNTFKASSGWLENFKSRHNLNLNNRQQIPNFINSNIHSNITNIVSNNNFINQENH
ncbi:hypothetical protein DICPUDRAFT_98416 [Dictyostelium purpureum]|uniref:HTH CENPB-type domain-containing protein n=1 Tax=Dictyostelium purpureum TaxID=5786 RepID=F0ZQ94_DICPU|nr:uncharacterized protein DICPUDRAFT_98416 [Dictyostelium purpureum]EGC33905.1 hypothetical protein DICPUDRAFT_98416 [Dictyostelium purpureum]|eukprot:XP_003289588.1 hypothetical protein DICPUDRAFT_98416 [Dictyostelium purpureum]